MSIIKEYNQFLSNRKINESISGKVRTRFAPSPTGALHCGGIRTALYNYLFSKKNGGDFILRIEDTDSSRFVPMAEKYIQDTFDWLGIEFDEGPTQGGSYGPYKQSERRDIYKKYYQDLIDSGRAYYSFDTVEELDDARANIPNFSYNYETRKKMKNSLTLDPEEVDNLLRERTDWVVRIKYPDNPIRITVDDLIRGKVTVDSSTLDDKVIWKKKDELPTYHLANVVDDHLMKITHVIRGEEWLPSAPFHKFLYNCFGWESPYFAHLPLILGPDGGKLSKRHGDKYGFPVFPLTYSNNDKTVEGYREAGYLPEAVINILAFIGWNPGTEKEVYTVEELINDFDLSRINKSGGKFNHVKASWFNGQHINRTQNEDLLEDLKEDLKKRGIEINDEFALQLLNDYKGKINFIHELYDEISYLFEKPTNYDKKVLSKWTPEAKNLVDEFSSILINLNNWTVRSIKNKFEDFIKSSKINYNDLVAPLRLLLTGKSYGSSIFGIMDRLGRKETLERLKTDLPLSTKSEVKTGIPEDKIQAILKEIDLIKGLIVGGEKKLSNKNFVERAPKQVVENERIKIEELKNRLIELENSLS